MADRLIGLTEETRVIAKRIEAESIVWVAKSRIVAGGKAVLDEERMSECSPIKDALDM